MERGLERLKEEIVAGPLCTACGACVGLCPYIVSFEDRVAAVGTCLQEDGQCYLFCPRSHPEDASSGATAGDQGYAGPVGPVLSRHEARAVPGADAPFQYGGAVTALLVRALRDGMIDAAVVTRWEDGAPRAVLARTEEEIAAAAGSKFAVSPTVAEVNRALRAGPERLGVVALPCQATALAQMRTALEGEAAKPAEEQAHRVQGKIALIIGLFCTWALGQRGWFELLGGRPDSSALGRVDIPPPPARVMEVEYQGETRRLPLEEVKEHVRDACRVCLDMTAENADLSAGTVEGRPGWSTVLVRTELGRKALSRAAAEGDLEAEEMDESRFEHLAEASVAKKLRAIEEAESWDVGLPHLEFITVLKERIRS